MKMVNRRGSEIGSFDDIGVYTKPMPDDALKYNFKEIKAYCREQRKGLADMTEEEIEQFRSK